MLQAIPSINYFEDRDQETSAMKFGLQWQVIPVSYSFKTNKYISPLSFFYINPVKRFTGSAELFFQPEYIPGKFKYSMLKNFMWKSGIRIIFPFAQRGEYLSASVGAGYYSQKNEDNTASDGLTVETGIYSFFGMLGLKFNYNVKAVSRYTVGLYLKYY